MKNTKILDDLSREEFIKLVVIKRHRQINAKEVILRHQLEELQIEYYDKFRELIEANSNENYEKIKDIAKLFNFRIQFDFTFTKEKTIYSCNPGELLLRCAKSSNPLLINCRIYLKGKNEEGSLFFNDVVNISVIPSEFATIEYCVLLEQLEELNHLDKKNTYDEVLMELAEKGGLFEEFKIIDK